eukprot:894118_1
MEDAQPGLAEAGPAVLDDGDARSETRDEAPHQEVRCIGAPCCRLEGREVHGQAGLVGGHSEGVLLPHFLVALARVSQRDRFPMPSSSRVSFSGRGGGRVDCCWGCGKDGWCLRCWWWRCGNASSVISVSSAASLVRRGLV